MWIKRTFWTICTALILGYVASSCVSVTETITLASNGSGTYALTVDLSQMIDILEELSKPDSGASNTLGSVDIAGNFKFDGKSKDTTIYFKDMPDSVRRRISRPEVFEKASLNLLMDAEKKDMLVNINLAFDKVADINYFFSEMDELSEKKEEANPMAGALNGSEPSFKWSKGVFSKEVKDSKAIKDQEDMGMSFDIGDEFTYTMVYNMPGKVLKVDHPKAKISGNKVTIKIPMGDLAKKQSLLSTKIQYAGN